MSPIKMAACAALLAAPLTAASQQSTFRCQAADGKKHYGNSIPVECHDRPVEQINSQGRVIRRIEPDAGEKGKGEGAADKAAREKQTSPRR
jgi:hypothetical protein